MGRRKNYPWDSKVDKQMTNLVSSLFTGIIYAPFLLFSSSQNKDLDSGEVMDTIIVAILLLPFILLTPFIWDVLYGFNFIVKLLFLLLFYVLIGCIEGYLIYKVSTIVDKLENKYDSIVYYIVFRSYKSRYRKIREEYFNTVRNNNRAKSKVIELHNKIKHYQNLLDKNVGTGKEQKYRDIIEKSHQELYKIKRNIFNVYRTDYKEPIIQLPCNQKEALPDFYGYVYLSIDKNFTIRKTIKIEEIVPLSNNGKMFFKTNSKPLKSLFNESFTIHFYDRFLLLMTKKNFTIVGYEDIIGSYTNTGIEFCLGSKSYPKTIERNHLDCTPVFRKDDTNKYVMVDVGTLQLKFFSRKINILFTKHDEGKIIYELISNVNK